MLVVAAALAAVVVVVGVAVTRPGTGSSFATASSPAGSAEPTPTASVRSAFVSAFVSQPPVALTSATAQQIADDGITLCGLARSDHRSDLANALNHVPDSGASAGRYDAIVTRIGNDVGDPVSNVLSDAGVARLNALLVNFERDSSAYFCPDKPAGA